ncbi:PD40 domain-containing protein [Tautonia rosea]|uniref:PD40 domain-containing protein n=1 Tax=Tautonia rosea TaxID=2728037 RepID=UPI001473FDB0|nr:PD40 domain-containing protein [Tautonia rosea]
MLLITLAVPVAAWGQGAASVFVVGVNGNGLRTVAASGVGPEGFHRAAYPSWSPDGRFIAFTAFDTTGRRPEIRIVSRDGGPSRTIVGGVAPSWSHDGSKLAFMISGKRTIATDWTRPGRNDERVAIVPLDRPEVLQDVGAGLWPRWSPTDDRLAFSSRQEASWDIFVRSADGMSLARLSDNPAMDTEPIWTPDGREVIFLSNRGVRWDLYRAPADGSAVPRRLTNHPSREENASLSPDASRIAFTDQPGRPNSRILILDLASEVVRPLLPDPLGDRDPTWSPDGLFIAFASRRPLP